MAEICQVSMIVGLEVGVPRYILLHAEICMVHSFSLAKQSFLGWKMLLLSHPFSSYNTNKYLKKPKDYTL